MALILARFDLLEIEFEVSKSGEITGDVWSIERARGRCQEVIFEELLSRSRSRVR